MKTRSRYILAIMAVLALSLTVSAAPAERAEGRPSKAMEAPLAAFDRAAHFERMSALRDQLESAPIDISGAAALEVVFSADERRSVRQGNANEKRMRVGIARELAIPMDFDRGAISDRGSRHDAFGAMRSAGAGFLWAGKVRSPEAVALRVHFTDFDLPEGSELYVYAGEMAFGPYTGKGPNGTGDFWSNTTVGSEVTIQLHAGAAGNPRFNIAGVGHMTEEFAMARNLVPREDAGSVPCSFNASCVVDAACVSTNSAVNTAANAVAHMLYISGAYYYICSGGLVADSDTSTNIPYFLTANHCVSRASEASSLETFFFYKAGSCGACPDPGASNTNGSTIVSGSKTSDYTLLRLSQNAPSGAAFLGWNSTAIANNAGTALYRLSHPKGAPQSYSTHTVNTDRVTCRSWPRGPWIYSTDILGATEGGSSGSPVVNAAGQVVGQLSGGCGYNVNDVCDTAQNSTVDGAFAAYYSSVSSILGSGSGGGGCTDADGDGYCTTQGDCNDSNPNIHPGANDTKGQQGRNGIDEDCDGTPDA